MAAQPIRQEGWLETSNGQVSLFNFLRKQRDSLKWKRRYLILDHDYTLWIKEDPEVARAKRVISERMMKSITVLEKDSMETSKECMFQVVLKDEFRLAPLLLRAHSHQEMETWVEAISDGLSTS